MPDKGNKKGNAPRIQIPFGVAAAMGPAGLGIYLSDKIMHSTGGNNSVRDIPRDVAMGIGYAYDFVTGNANRGDRGVSARWGATIENWWNKNVKPGAGLEGSDMRMAAGWTIHKGTRVNGVVFDGTPQNLQRFKRMGVGIEADGTMKDMSAIFVREHGGPSEVITMKDKRWKNYAVPYLGVQAGFMAGSFFIGMPEVAVGGKFGAALNTSRTIFNASAKVEGALEGVGNLALAGKGLADGAILTPAAINRIGHMFSDPSKLNGPKFIKDINQVLGTYSNREGPFSQQFYFPSLADNSSPYKRLEELSRGNVWGYKRQDPFESFSRKGAKIEDIPISNLQNGLRHNTEFQLSFLKVADKYYSGKTMTNGDILTLRFGMNALFDDSLSIRSMRFSAKEVQETYQHLNAAMYGSVYANELEAKLKRQKVPQAKIDERINTIIEDTSFPLNRADIPKEVGAMVHQKTLQMGQAYAAEQAAEMRQMQARAQAMAMAM